MILVNKNEKKNTSPSATCTGTPISIHIHQTHLMKLNYLASYTLFFWNQGLKVSESFSPLVPQNVGRTKKSTATTSTRLNVDLITFDLDDTIFPVGPVVHDANCALISHLNNNGYDAITQESLIASTKLIRTQLRDDGDKVITYTELRKRAICLEMNKQNEDQGRSESEYLFTDPIVCQAYDLWELNRHLAAETHLYYDAIEMLQSLKEQYPDAIIGAITNGKGNPLKMKQTIQQFFDFCISGEDDNVFPYRKPHKEIYLKTLDYYKNLDDDVQQGDGSEDFCWVHVGDDLANDVGASAKCGALAVWADLSEEYNQSASKRTSPEKGTNDVQTKDDSNKEQEAQPFWSTATKEELEKRKKLNDESLKFVSAKIERLNELPTAIKNITTKSIQSC